MVTKLNKSTTTLQAFLGSDREFSSMERQTPFHVPQLVILGNFSMHIKRKHSFKALNDNVTMIDLFNLVWIWPQKQNSSNKG